MSDAKSGEEIFKPKCTDQFHTVKKDAGHKQDDWTMSHLRSSNLSVKMFFYAANKAVSVNEADFWEKSYPLRQKLLVPLLFLDVKPEWWSLLLLLLGISLQLYNQLPPESPQRPSSSELLAFSESIKSKFSAASARYKESFSKFT
ncbi:hypothetical protein RHGRI_004643 [Rhododendron griersonianum]|uniref:Uncharacterized protein n=1 Tax=Rhododendron griersonianum TaxID=479676 RepID=A0AAV6L9M0_9ERIC|nr:hypothetical protein RHGRI_004643 [Rhododendron griersonianum]